jgi:hypothetical protein
MSTLAHVLMGYSIKVGIRFRPMCHLSVFGHVGISLRFDPRDIEDNTSQTFFHRDRTPNEATYAQPRLPLLIAPHVHPRSWILVSLGEPVKAQISSGCVAPL